ncbi:MAG: hypothetical protein R2827_04450 [Bdellovibrionales bacterium]
MKKWCEISNVSDRERNEFVRQFLQDNGCENSVEFFEVGTTEIKKTIIDAQKEFDAIRIHPNYGIEALNAFEGIPSEMLFIGAADCWVKAEGGWWPRNMLYRAFHKVISKTASRLNLESDVLIIGTDATARGLCKWVF